MQKRRTQHFKFTLYTVFGISAIFLACLFFFGKGLLVTHFSLMNDCVFSVMALAVGSFIGFSFLPYFHGDKRWYSISALLVAVFFVGTVFLWQAPITGTVIA